MRSLLPVVLIALLACAPARADETGTPSGPTLELEHLDLLPLGEFERADYREAHPELSKRLQSLAGRIRGLERKVEALGAKKEKEAKPLRAEIEKLQAAADAPLAELRDTLREHGLTDGMLLAMASAPRGARRVERYSHQLVLLLDDLDAGQREIFGRVVPEVDGAYLSAQALKDRTELALKQSGLEKRQVQGVLSTFGRQTRVLESRFWRLVDYALEDDQKAALWEMLPSTMRRHSSPQDHVYALPGLAPTQGARVKALVTEIEAESAPDQALVNRLRVAMRKKGIARDERKSMQQEQRDANQRLLELRRFAHDAALEILTDSQVHAMKAIPPRVSINDRRRDGKRVFAGMAFSASQEDQMTLLRKEGREAAKAYRARVQEIRKESGDIGPDSPQMMMMEMMSASARGEALAMQRLLIGMVFRKVLTPDQISGWVQGLYGDRR